MRWQDAILALVWVLLLTAVSYALTMVLFALLGAPLVVSVFVGVSLSAAICASTEGLTRRAWFDKL